jgi:hypothetical protein
MSSEHNFSQRVVDENFNKTLRSDLSSEDLNNLRSYFETALQVMSRQHNNTNIQLSRNALENLSKTHSLQHITNTIAKKPDIQ